MKKFLAFIVATLITWGIGFAAFSIFAPKFSIDATYGEMLQKSLLAMMLCYGIPLAIIEFIMTEVWSSDTPNKLDFDGWGIGLLIIVCIIAYNVKGEASHIIFNIGCFISLLITVLTLDKLK